MAAVAPGKGVFYICGGHGSTGGSIQHKQQQHHQQQLEKSSLQVNRTREVMQHLRKKSSLQFEQDSWYSFLLTLLGIALPLATALSILALSGRPRIMHNLGRTLLVGRECYFGRHGTTRRHEIFSDFPVFGDGSDAALHLREEAPPEESAQGGSKGAVFPRMRLEIADDRSYHT